MRFKLLMILCAITAGCSNNIRDSAETAEKIISGFNGDPVVPQNANTIFIMQPVNSTGLRILAPKLYDKIKEHISLEGRLGVVPDEINTDLRLEVRIAQYAIERLRYDAVGRPIQNRMRITADVRLLNQKKKKLIFQEMDIQAFRVYSELTQPIETESQVRDYVLDDLARRIASKTLTGWYTDRMTIIEKGKL
jgi:hypothetical protein